MTLTDMKNAAIGLWLLFSGVRLVPHIMLMLLGSRRCVIEKDLDRWGQILLGQKPAGPIQYIVLLVRLMTFKQEYRNLFYYLRNTQLRRFKM